jgi:hypothetical protein
MNQEEKKPDGVDSTLQVISIIVSIIVIGYCVSIII